MSVARGKRERSGAGVTDSLFSGRAPSITPCPLPPLAGVAFPCSTIRTSLESHRAGILAADRLDPLIRAVDVFGFHMAVMDVRQNSKVGRVGGCAAARRVGHACMHRRRAQPTHAPTRAPLAWGPDGLSTQVHEVVVAELLQHAGAAPAYLSLPETDRVAVLAAELSSPRLLFSPFLSYSERTVGELAVVRTIADVHARLGARAAPHYVISNCESLSDLLEVAILLKEAGLVHVIAPPAGSDATATVTSAMQIVPLFETIADLYAGAAVMASSSCATPFPSTHTHSSSLAAWILSAIGWRVHPCCRRQRCSRVWLRSPYVPLSPPTLTPVACRPAPSSCPCSHPSS